MNASTTAGLVPPSRPTRGYSSLYRKTVLQAPGGCDLDFLVGDAAGN